MEKNVQDLRNRSKVKSVPPKTVSRDILLKQPACLGGPIKISFLFFLSFAMKRGPTPPCKPRFHCRYKSTKSRMFRRRDIGEKSKVEKTIKYVRRVFEIGADRYRKYEVFTRLFEKFLFFFCHSTIWRIRNVHIINNNETFDSCGIDDYV